MTPAEARLWVAIRREALGVKFRRQHPVGPFILDFYCPEQRLAVEVDGPNHDFVGEYDARRTRWLGAQGIRVVRCTNEEVRDNLEGVLQWLTAEIVA